MENCFYCARDKRLLAIMEPVCRLDWSRVYFLRNQRHRGRCVVALHRHVRELYEMEPEERNGFFRETAAVAHAVACLYKPDKINYAVYGDLVSHYHVHIVPKYKNGPDWGGPFSDGGEERLLTPEDLRGEIRQLQEKLQRILET